MQKFWNSFYKKPLDKIPWQHTQDDWFKELVDNHEFFGETILDIGCGTGKKSIYLAEHTDAHKIIGIDIAPQAIAYAKQNARDAQVANICSFHVEDISQPTTTELCDAILDWATIHTLTRGSLPSYAHYIDTHLKKDGRYLVRAFTSDSNKTSFVETIDDLRSEILLLSEQEIVKLFPHFELLKKNMSASRTKQDFYFIEMLFQKK